MPPLAPRRFRNRRPLQRGALLLALALGLALPAAPALAAPLDEFFAAHPDYAVLPTPYFEQATREASYLEVLIHAPAFVPPGVPWRAEIDAGRRLQVPAAGHTTDRTWQGFLELGSAPVPRATVSIYTLEHGTERLVARVGLGSVRPQRFSATYQRGPFAKQASREWGEDGIWLVLLQMRHAPEFRRSSEPLLYIGGDFYLKRIERLVRFMRVSGYNALGYRPAYERRAESLAEMGRLDLPDVHRLLTIAAPGRLAHAIGVCVGGLHARALAHADAASGARRIASVTGIGTPNLGSELADLYNRTPLLSKLEQLATGGPERHPFKDAGQPIIDFNRDIRPAPGVPQRMVVLDTAGMAIDDKYVPSEWLLQLLVGAQTGRRPGSIPSDGLLTVESQELGPRFATWRCDHSGMLNYGRTSETFDAYAAHRALAATVTVSASEETR